MAKIENSTTPKVGVIMGSVSDWETMKEACDVLEQLQVAFEKKVVSAHRTPQWLTKYAEDAEEQRFTGDHRRCWRRSASSWYGCLSDTPSRDWCSRSYFKP